MSKAPSPAPAVFSIAAGVPFVDALAQGVLDESGGAADLSATRILLPTRRACRALGDAFLRRSGGRATLLPRMTALGEVDEDELALETWDSGFGGGGGDVPPAVPGLKRQLLLSRLIMALDRDGTTPDQAARLAVELARLLDQVHTERLSFDALAALVPDAFAEHWQKTLKFLTILTERWPKVLAEIEAIDPAKRRNLLLDAQGRAWKAAPPDFPVIAAGSTGSIPATADLLGVIAALPRGRVVLPGLDQALSGDAWKALKPSHPQYGMGRLLDRLGVQPGDVRPWTATGFARTPSPRGALINAALRPAGHPLKNVHDLEALGGLERVDCAEPGQEATVIALIMRQTLETPGQTCALVTPDRGLARRVAAELGRWHIKVDDSAGVPMAQTPPGAFLRLTARTAAEGFAPVGLLAALKHPLAMGGAAGGKAAGLFRGRVRALEAAILRGPRPGPGLDGLKAALAPEARDAFADVLGCLEKAAGPFEALLRRKSAPFSELLAAHIGMAEALAASGDETASKRLWAGDAGENAAAFIYELNDGAETLGDIAGRLYPALLDALMAGRVVRPRYGRNSRLFIWGLLEARLQQADTLVLGGLNEDAWPPEAKANPWMSRPMLAAFGLPQPERRTGLTAHDFAQAFAAERVVITRSTRSGGAPTVPSRWLRRLDIHLKSSGPDDALRAWTGGRWPVWAAALDAPEKTAPLPPPAPRPPVAARPRELSVTRIETWIRDPYALYSQKILRLYPLDPIDAEPDAAQRGSIIHHALEEFHKAYPGDLPPDAVQKLIAIGGRELANRLAPPGVRAFWWPRFIRIAEWFVANERRRREAGYSIAGAEISGSMKIAAPGGPFILTARADRIDRIGRVADGSLAIIDFKTGQAPSAPQVECGLAPQLSLEAALAEAGGFDGIEAAPAGELTVIRLTGGALAGEEKTLNLDAREVAGTALAGLKKRIKQFDDPDTPYLSRPAPMFERYFGDYDHLARVREWSAAGGNDGDGG